MSDPHEDGNWPDDGTGAGEEIESEHLSHLSDAELGRRVRQTTAFRTAVACREFADEAQELRENDRDAFERLVRDAHDRQSTNVKKRATTEAIINAFINAVSEHAELASEPDDAAEKAAGEALEA